MTYLFLIVFLTILAWHKALYQSLLGEGMYYFDPIRTFALVSSGNVIQDILNSYDAGALIFFDMTKNIIGDRIIIYQVIGLLSEVLINTFLFLLVRQITGRDIIALVASIFFGVNFNAYEMLAVGNYQWFVQRVLALLFLLPSLAHFFRGNYWRSLIWYIASFLFFHYSLFFAPYFFFSFIVKGKKTFIRLIPFILIPILLLPRGYDTTSYMGSNYVSYLLTFIQTHREQILQSLMQQLTIATIPVSWITDLTTTYRLSHNAVAQILLLPTLLAYACAMFMIWKLASRMVTQLAIWSLISVYIILFLNLFINWDLTNNLSSGSRYLYFPSIGVSLFWAIFFGSIWKIPAGRVLAVIFLVYWSASGISSLWKAIDAEQYKHEASLKSLRFVKELSPRFLEDSIVVLPNIIGYHGANFVQYFYGKEHTYFLPKFALEVKPLPRQFDPTKDFIIDYDYEARTVKDMTNAYRSVIPDYEK